MPEPEAPEGFHWEWRVDDQWVALEPEDPPRRCAIRGCQDLAVARLNRGRRDRLGHVRPAWWRHYCHAHLYGRRIVTRTEVQSRRLVKDRDS